MFNTKVELVEKILRDKKIIKENEKGIFITKDCILIEKKTEKSYTYTAYNYFTFEKKYLGHSKATKDTRGLQQLISKIKELEFYNITYPKDYSKLIEFIFKKIFTLDSKYKVRDEQVQLSKEFFENMKYNKKIMSDIPTGFGKTHSYIIASVVYNEYLENKDSLNNKNNKIVISTSSKQLQNVIVNDYLPSINELLRSFDIVRNDINGMTIKGKENYICDIRLKDYINSLSSKKNKIEFNNLNYLLNNKKVDLSIINNISNYDKKRICVKSHMCKYCYKKGFCNYNLMLNKMNSKEILFIVTNHNYLVADSINKNIGNKKILPNYKALVIDEAHKIYDVAVNMNTNYVEYKQLYDFIFEIKPKNMNKSNKKIFKSCTNYLKLLKRLFARLKSSVDIKEEVEEYLVKITVNIKEIISKLIKELKNINLYIQDTYKKKLLNDIVVKLNEILKNEKMVVWLKDIKNDNESKICFVRNNLSGLIKEQLFNNNIPMIMTSGTLKINSSFDYFKNNLGLRDNVQEISKISNYDYYKNTLLYQTYDLPLPYKNNYEYEISQRIIKLLNVSNGRALILFTSYEVMRKVYFLVKEKVKYPLFTLEKSDSSKIEQYKNSKNGVLFATGSAWEGLDFKGEILSHLILVKLPFLIPSPITEYQKNNMSDEEFKNEILIPQMLIKLLQGHGRAIRSESDRAIISILDVRANKGYKDVVMNALPKCRVVNEIEKLKGFL